MTYLILAALIIGISIFSIKQLLALFQANMCERCNGQGYWLGTRGDKNHCKACDGTGRR